MRTKTREILLFEAMFLMVTVLLFALSMENEICRNMEELQELSESYFEISADTGKVLSVAHMVDESLCTDIMKDENIKAYNGKANFYLNLSELELIPADLPEPENEEAAHIAKFIGSTDARKETSFYQRVFELVKGEYVEPEDKYSVLISEELAEKNHLDIGDSFTGCVTENVSWQDENSLGSSFSFVVKGIYRVCCHQKSQDRYTAQAVCENYIFTNISTAQKILSCLIGVEVDWYNSASTFFVNDSDSLSETVDRVKKNVDINWSDYKVAEKDERYQKVLLPMEKLSLRLGVLTAVEIILCFLVVYRYQRGQLEQKKRDKKQILNVLLILAAATGLAMLLVVAAGEDVSNRIIEQFVDVNVDEYMTNWITSLNLKAGLREFVEIAAVVIVMLLTEEGILFVRSKKTRSIYRKSEKGKWPMRWDEFKRVWKESGHRAQASRERDREARKEKRRRETFPGKYSKLLYLMFWKNFLYNWKDYILFIICGVAMTSVTFTLLDSYQVMTGFHSDEGVMVGIAGVGEGLRRILVNAAFPLGTCAVFLLVYVLIFYLKKRMLSYSMFVTLGIRKKALHIAVVIEIGISIILSLILGCLMGTVFTLFIRQGVNLLLGEKVLLFPIAGNIYQKTFFIVILIYVVAFVGIVFATDFNPVSVNSRQLQSERIPKNKLKLFMIIGSVLTLLSCLLYSQIWNFEKVYLVGTFCAGLFLLLRYGGAAYLRKEKLGRKYLPKLMDRNQLYHKSSTTAWYLIGLVIIHLCAVFYFTFPAVSITVAEEPESLFPYDFMCVADEGDDEFFQELKEKYDAEIISYPMVRVISVDKTQKLETRRGYLPQGQNIGISETTYHELKKALDPEYQMRLLELDEEGEKVCIVHQQDRSIKAQPIDYTDFFKTKPFLHIGLPCRGFDTNTYNMQRAYPKRTIVREEIGSLTGCYRQGTLENLVVFSDEYFKEAQEMWKDTYIVDGFSIKEKCEKYGYSEEVLKESTLQGPTKLVLVNAEAEVIDAIEEKMKELEEKHYVDYELSYDTEINCWYSSRDAILDMKSERIMKLIVNTFVIVVLAVTGMFLLLMKVFSEMEEKKDRAVFLKCMGMRRKDRIHMLKKELYLFYLVPFVVTSVAAVLFTAATFYARMYTADVMKAYLLHAAPVWAGYFLIQWIFIWILGKVVIRKVEKKDERK